MSRHRGGRRPDEFARYLFMLAAQSAVKLLTLPESIAKIGKLGQSRGLHAAHTADIHQLPETARPTGPVDLFLGVWRVYQRTFFLSLLSFSSSARRGGFTLAANFLDKPWSLVGITPPAPRHVPSFLSRIEFSVPIGRRFASNFANSLSRTLG